MGDVAGGSPPGEGAPQRRGWRLPEDAPPSRAAGSPPADVERPDEGRLHRPPPPNPTSAPPTTLPKSVTGLARAVNVTSVVGANGAQETVVTFRLEQYDARAGRTGVVTVRLFGHGAIGFVAEGDWVEVTGKTKRGFIDASQAVNHTSRAQYSRSGQGCAKVAMIVAFALVVLFIVGIFVSIIASVLAGG